MPSHKSPAQIEREIAQSLGKRIDRKKLGSMMFPWGSDFSYGQGSGAVGAVASYYASDKKYPDRLWVERALKAIEADIPMAEHGAHGWTKADVKDLRKIAAGLRYYLVHDYKESGTRGSSAHASSRGHRAGPRKTLHAVRKGAGRSWKQLAEDYKKTAKAAKEAGGKVKRWPDGSILILPVEGADEYFYQDWQADELVDETKRKYPELLEHISLEDFLLAQSQHW